MPRFGSSRRGWLMASYAGAAAFFALEAVAREPGEASDLAATESDQGTTRLIVAAYGGATARHGLIRGIRRLACAVARVTIHGVTFGPGGLPERRRGSAGLRRSP
jgi:hypothetical protein